MSDIVDVNPVCPKCGTENYGTMILFNNGKCGECGAVLEIKRATK